MKDKKNNTPISKTGATILLVTSMTNSDTLCEPSEECRPLCEPCTDEGPECAPDCTCSPCEEEEKSHALDQDHYNSEEDHGEADQGCEPNY